MYTRICTIEMDLGHIPLSPRTKANGMGVYYYLGYDLVLFFSSVELRAQLAWTEGGVERRHVDPTAYGGKAADLTFLTGVLPKLFTTLTLLPTDSLPCLLIFSFSHLSTSCHCIAVLSTKNHLHIHLSLWLLTPLSSSTEIFHVRQYPQYPSLRPISRIVRTCLYRSSHRTLRLRPSGA